MWFDLVVKSVNMLVETSHSFEHLVTHGAFEFLRVGAMGYGVLSEILGTSEAFATRVANEGFARCMGSFVLFMSTEVLGNDWTFCAGESLTTGDSSGRIRTVVYFVGYMA